MFGSSCGGFGAYGLRCKRLQVGTLKVFGISLKVWWRGWSRLLSEASGPSVPYLGFRVEGLI